MFDYEARDETPNDPEIKFKISFFLTILDTVINSITERFNLLSQHAEKFNFLSNFNIICSTDGATLKKYCNDLQISLSDEEEMDISGAELFDEIKIFRDTNLHICREEDSLNILQFIFDNNLDSAFPNLTIAIKILLTLPVSVASSERSFSKLKLIKTYLRSTISQERFVGLSLISIESEICDNIDASQILEKFVSIKARKIAF